MLVIVKQHKKYVHVALTPKWSFFSLLHFPLFTWKEKCRSDISHQCFSLLVYNPEKHEHSQVKKSGIPQ